MLITYVITMGVGGKHLSNPPSTVPVTASTILSFASTLAGFAVTYSSLSSDFTSYFPPKTSRCGSRTVEVDNRADFFATVGSFFSRLTWDF